MANRVGFLDWIPRSVLQGVVICVLSVCVTLLGTTIAANLTVSDTKHAALANRVEVIENEKEKVDRAVQEALQRIVSIETNVKNLATRAEEERSERRQIIHKIQEANLALQRIETQIGLRRVPPASAP